MFNFSLAGRFARKKLADNRDNYFRMAYAWCGDPALADDLVQEMMLKSLEKSHQLKNISRFLPWSYQILHNCWLSHLRAQKPNVDFDEEMVICEDCPERSYQTDMIGQAVHLAIGKLPIGQKQVLMLIDLEGFSYKEVAEILTIPMGTVMSRVSRARTSLEKSLSAMREPAETNIRKLRSIK
jgi:RNA polymerase sigma-70 factor (ECF subfamily)